MTGNIGLVASGGIWQTADISTSEGDLLVVSGGPLSMSSASRSSARNILVDSGSDIELGLLDAEELVSLSSGGSIVDAGLDELTDVRAAGLRMTAAGLIGGPDPTNGSPAVNVHAIDLEVGTVAASSHGGIYLQEVSAGGDLMVGLVPDLSVSVSISQVWFNSTVSSQSSSLSHTELSDLETFGEEPGPIKVVVDAGSLTILDGGDGDGAGVTAFASGDILLWASEDIVASASVSSGSGHITLYAGDDVWQRANISTRQATIFVQAMNAVTTGESLNGVVMDDNVVTSVSRGIIRVESFGDIVLGRLDTVESDPSDGIVSLFASGSIRDGAGDLSELNVRSGQLEMEAGRGIGGADVDNGSADENLNAIDSQVVVMSAQAVDGVYVREADDLTIGQTETIEVVSANFNSTTSTSIVASRADLTTVSGPIKILSLSGTILLEDGDSDGIAVSTETELGDVLLQTLGDRGDLVVEADIVTDAGNVSLAAADDVSLQATVRTGSRTGDVNIWADNRHSDDLQGVVMESGTQILAGGNTRIAAGNEGDILLSVLRSENVSLAAEGSILDNRPQVLLTATVSAGSDEIHVTDGSSFSAGDLIVIRPMDGSPESHEVLAVTGDRLTLKEPIATTISTASDAIVNALNVTASNLRMVADADIGVDGTIESDVGDRSGRIGERDTSSMQPHFNRNAIDTAVSTIAAQSADGIYVQELDSISVGATGDLLTEFSRFNSSNTDIIDSNLDDLTTTSNGAIKLDSLSGSIEVSDGLDADGVGVSAGGSGDVLISARGSDSNQDVRFIDADVRSQSGHITLDANRNVELSGSELQTGGLGSVLIAAGQDQLISGQLSTEGGDILLSADRNIQFSGDILSDRGNLGIESGQDIFQEAKIRTSGDVFASSGGDMTMSTDSEIRAGDDLLVVAGSDDVDQTITLGLLAAVNVSLDATGDILDGNLADESNIRADNVRLVADSNQNGIGGVGTVAAPIDLEGGKLAASATEGVYLRELAEGGDLRIDHVDAVTAGIDVQRVRFNSTTLDQQRSRTIDALDDVEAVRGRELGQRAVEVRVVTGDLVITDGNDADSRGVFVSESGSILLTTLESGNIAIQTGIETTGSGADGNITLDSAGWIDELARDDGGDSSDAAVVGDSLTLQAGGFAHLHDTTVNSLSANVGSNGSLDGGWQQTNSAANDRGDDFLMDLGQERLDFAGTDGVIVEFDPSATGDVRDTSIRESFDEVARQFRFEDTYLGQYALFLQNTQELTVDAIESGRSESPNVYVETQAAGADLNIAGTVITRSSAVEEGGIVLVAGGELNLQGSLATELSLTESQIRSQLVDQIGDQSMDGAVDGRIAYLDAAAFDGGDGVPAGDERLTSTQFVLRDQQLGLSAAAEDFRSHVFQRVIMQFGFEGESGFVSFVGYADGEVQQFDVAGEEGVRSKSVDELNADDQSSIIAKPQAVVDAAAFSRAIAFDNAFLDSNQMLPTSAIVRRSADFFLFENAAVENADEIRDMTFESFEIENVFALGARGATELPQDPPPVEPADIQPIVLTALVDSPAPIVATEIELQIPQEKTVEVAIYRVFYDDDNDNGQAEETELPGIDDVLSAEIIDEDDTESSGESDIAQGKRYKLESVETEEGGSPTAEKIEQLKNRYLNSPEQPSGAYAIIEKGVDDKEVVLDVFSVRDFQEPTSDDDGPLFQKAGGSSSKTDASGSESENAASEETGNSSPSPTEGAFKQLPGEHRSEPSPARFADARVVMGSVWFATQVASSRRPSLMQSVCEKDGQPIGFCSRARRSRRIARFKDLLVGSPQADSEDSNGA